MDQIDLEYRIVGNGAATLVIETGIGCSYYNWMPLVEKIKSDYTVVLYHRAGYGKSSRPEQPRSTANIAKGLHVLLDELEVSGKFVLIGHSFGGLCAQHYAKMYPHQIESLILLDSTSVDFQALYDLDLPVMYSIISLEKMIESNRESANKTSVQLLEEMSSMIEEQKKVLHTEDLDSYEDFITDPQLFETIAQEFQGWEKSSKQIKALGTLPDVPVFVIARDQDEAAKPFIQYGIPEDEAVLHEKEWRRLQQELALTAEKRRFVIAEQSDHDIHLDRPDVVLKILKQARSEQDEYIW